jgi:hypothetical protein
VTDSVSDVGRLGGVDHPADVEFDERGENVEKAAAFAQEDRDLVDLDLVEDAGLKGSLCDVGATDLDILAGGSLRLFHGALDAVGDVGDQGVAPAGGRRG